MTRIGLSRGLLRNEETRRRRAKKLPMHEPNPANTQLKTYGNNVRFLLLISLLGVAGFVVAKHLFPAPGPLGLGIRSYINCCAVVGVTNLSRVTLGYFVKVERKYENGWP